MKGQACSKSKTKAIMNVIFLEFRHRGCLSMKQNTFKITTHIWNKPILLRESYVDSSQLNSIRFSHPSPSGPCASVKLSGQHPNKALSQIATPRQPRNLGPCAGLISSGQHPNSVSLQVSVTLQPFCQNGTKWEKVLK